jgi:uracil-DNA glycosylase
MTIAIHLPPGDGLAAFRSYARCLLAEGYEPAAILWNDTDTASLFADAARNLGSQEKPINVPRSFIAVAELVACHQEPVRWAKLYEALWLIDQGDRRLMEKVALPLVRDLTLMADSVRRAAHRMTAFIRFRPVMSEKTEHFVAWYEPQHYIVRLTSQFFIDRYANMRFSILTPDLTLHWDCSEARFGPGVSRDNAPSADTVEEYWKRYYAATFNPARSNPDLMKRHIPNRFWRDLPEAAVIPSLLDNAARRTEQMITSKTNSKR